MKDIVIDLLAIEPLSWKGLGMIVLCSMIIGWERQWMGKPAGMRTSMLICLGAYIFIKLSVFLSGGVGTDASRVLGQIVTGIGFLGAGVMFNKDDMVMGVTSAASIWVLAAVGCLIGFDKFPAAIAVSILSVVFLIGISLLENGFRKLKRGVYRKNE